MSSRDLNSEVQIGRRSLLGRRSVEVLVNWRRNYSPDLSSISRRRATSIRLVLVGTSQSSDVTYDLDLEHTVAIRDLLTQAIDSTRIDGDI